MLHRKEFGKVYRKSSGTDEHESKSESLEVALHLHHDNVTEWTMILGCVWIHRESNSVLLNCGITIFRFRDRTCVIDLVVLASPNNYFTITLIQALPSSLHSFLYSWASTIISCWCQCGDDWLASFKLCFRQRPLFRHDSVHTCNNYLSCEISRQSIVQIAVVSVTD